MPKLNSTLNPENYLYFTVLMVLGSGIFFYNYSEFFISKQSPYRHYERICPDNEAAQR